MLRTTLPIQHTGLRGYLASRLFLAGWALVTVVTMPLLALVVPVVMRRLPDEELDTLSSGLDRP